MNGAHVLSGGLAEADELERFDLKLASLMGRLLAVLSSTVMLDDEVGTSRRVDCWQF